ncbi:hypothetical protein MKW98_007118 [Papaver atlanticum]|uniref:Rad60/SUMO-like domain-containing protein n=1 Tax=Papaver atlanticum TaxID=357466 RepID=A0AAD4XFS2_9MAGN|nr:hypothetical protein MKW98_007118 [Papaver atlanticum]
MAAAGVPNAVKVEAKKASDAEPVSHINIKIRSNDYGDTEVCFRVKRNAKIGKLMEAYGEAKKVDYRTLRFLHEGVRIKEEHTTDQLEQLEEGDDIEIQVFHSMMAGGYRNHLM